MKKKDKVFSVSSLITACFIYGFFPIFVRTIGFKLPIFFQNWTRSSLEFLIIILPVIIFKKWVKVIPKDYGWLIFRSLGGFVGFFGAYFAFFYLPIGTAFFVSYAGSLIGGFFLGGILFQEKITKLKLVSLLIGMVGLFFVYSFSVISGQIIYLLLAAASGFGTALWNVSSKKISSRYSAIQLNFIDIIIYGLFVFLISVLIKEPWAYPAANIVWLANFIFAFTLIVTGQLMVYGFRHVEGQLGSLVMMLEVVFGIIFGFLFYKETVSIKTLFGGSLILFALILSQLKIKNKLLS